MRFGLTMQAGQEPGHAAQRLARDECGVSAIEFALVAPLIFFSFLAMTDVGFALRERIALDHLLRSGAQLAMRDGGENAVLNALENSACKTDETYPDCESLAVINFGVVRYCECPTTGVKDTTCTSTCAEQPKKFYEISATQTYDGIFKLQLDFNPSILVEVR